MIHIYDENEVCVPHKLGWDFPLEEIDYLCMEHDKEDFILKDGRLYEWVQ